MRGVAAELMGRVERAACQLGGCESWRLGVGHASMLLLRMCACDSHEAGNSCGLLKEVGRPDAVSSKPGRFILLRI